MLKLIQVSKRLEVSYCLNLAVANLYVKHEIKAWAKFILPVLVTYFHKVPQLLHVESAYFTLHNPTEILSPQSH